VLTKREIRIMQISLDFARLLRESCRVQHGFQTSRFIYLSPVSFRLWYVHTTVRFAVEFSIVRRGALARWRPSSDARSGLHNYGICWLCVFQPTDADHGIKSANSFWSKWKFTVNGSIQSNITASRSSDWIDSWGLFWCNNRVISYENNRVRTCCCTAQHG